MFIVLRVYSRKELSRSEREEHIKAPTELTITIKSPGYKCHAPTELKPFFLSARNLLHRRQPINDDARHRRNDLTFIRVISGESHQYKPCAIWQLYVCCIMPGGAGPPGF